MKLGITMGRRGNMELGVVLIVIAILFFFIGSRGGGVMDFAIGFGLLILGSERINKARRIRKTKHNENDQVMGVDKDDRLS